ncbi:MAG: NPXTG-anchored protein [Oscillospiraceae bacterium]|nr:NPXTG-anchored protein [Oscillospiraceae bacterium]
MKNKSKIAILTAIATLAVNAVPFTAYADDNYIYGTMDIPYAEFYKAELGNTPYEVDAVSSATTTKWLKNGEGELFEGSYHSEANDDGSGQILGATYPVAITQADLDALGDNNYNFTALSETPEAFKIVTVSGGTADFSAVQDEAPETLDTTITLATTSRYGDYQINLGAFPENTAVYGALVKTTDGGAYAMRHEQNIWRQGALSWSCGITLTEGHGNTLDVENYDEISGKTISEVVYITKGGYLTVSTDTYVPIKFENTLTVENGTAGTGSVKMTKEGYPADYNFNYSVADNFSVGDDGIIAYTDAVPGTYTLTVSDADGKYASNSANFIISTEDIPVTYDAENKQLVPADGFTDEDAANFLKNLSAVDVNGTSYSASGRGAVAIIGSDGVINFEAVSKEVPVFNAEDGKYTITVTATGYSKPYVLEISDAEETSETEAETETESGTTSTTKSTTTTKATTTTAKSTTTTAKSTTTSSNSESPKTGDTSTALPAAVLAVAGLTVIASKKKK